MTKVEFAEFLRTFAKRLDSRARWLCDPTYGTSEKNAAVQDAYYGIAEELRSAATDLEVEWCG